MSDTHPAVIRLADYRPPNFLVAKVELHVELHECDTRVRARLELRRNPGADDVQAPLRLDGRRLHLLRLWLDGESLPAARYTVDDEGLTIFAVPDCCVLETESAIDPRGNTALEGLYLSGGMYCTQCEPEGFRKITWYIDRPDVLARFTTTIVAPADLPVLLANGNCIEAGRRGDGRHYVVWEDPFPKPAYLFALVAGRLAELSADAVTASGRSVRLRLFVEEKNRDKGDFALKALEQARRWDEERYGLEYDLDQYMVVAVEDFNMGAMENKGLNIFNARYVLARPDTATDADYQAIEGVIAHEYFHNWTGNRVTCRDWFQLSLKEGLTVFRDQQFSADRMGAAVKRIRDVQGLRSGQFPEDHGPLAHPVRPASYVEINNFYTATVYNKGAEVVRMFHTLLGWEMFHAGVQKYLADHDGTAATIEDFVAAMEAVSGRDFSQFYRWYDQAGTPVVAVSGEYDAGRRQYVLNVTQSCPPTPGQPEKEPFLIPLAVGLLGPDGKPLPLRLEGEMPENIPAPETRVLEVRRATERFVFTDLPAAPVPSLLRGFSAPVILEYDCDDEELGFLLAHDPDEFIRWEAGQQLMVRLVKRLVAGRKAGAEPVVDRRLAAAALRVLTDDSTDPALRALALTLPAENYLAEQFGVVDPEAIHFAREFLAGGLAAALKEPLLATYDTLIDPGHYEPSPAAIARRSLRNICLAYLSRLDDPRARSLAAVQYEEAANMTDMLAALSCLADGDHPARSAALASFYDRWRGDAQVVDKWFAVQAVSKRSDTLAAVRDLLDHPAFIRGNPNRVRALLGIFSQQNPARFHAADGGGYALLADQVLLLENANPQLAARLVQSLVRWQRLEPGRGARMRRELERVSAHPGLSRDVYEICARGLGREL
ncbi:MAG: aminopeptidase N [Deltaproteobacteria bacterium]|nr:aminopeptidase N [Candidatus Anaeroferrophillacea bacterium]